MCGHGGAGRGGWDGLGDWEWHVYTTMCKKDGWHEHAIKHRKLSSVVCDDLDGRAVGWGGWEVQEGGYRYTYGWCTSLYSGNWHNIVEKLSSNKEKYNNKAGEL